MNEKADLLPEQRFLRSILNTRELYSASSGLLCGSFASGRCCRHQGGILAHSNTGGVQEMRELEWDEDPKAGRILERDRTERDLCIFLSEYYRWAS